jgi:hypothetical protein
MTADAATVNLISPLGIGFMVWQAEKPLELATRIG